MKFPALHAFFVSRKSWLAITSALVTIAAHFRYDLDPRVTTIIVSSIFMLLAALIAWEDAAAKSAGPDITGGIVEQLFPLLESLMPKKDKPTPALTSVPSTLTPPISLEEARLRRDRAKDAADAAQFLYEKVEEVTKPELPTVIV